MTHRIARFDRATLVAPRAAEVGAGNGFRPRRQRHVVQRRVEEVRGTDPVAYRVVRTP